MNQSRDHTGDTGRSHYVDLAAGRFHYRHWASDPAAPSAVLVHGNGSTWTTWSRVAPALSAAGLNVLAPDLRGNGASVRPPVGAYGLPAVADDLRDLVEALRLRRPVLIGHCWGAAAALTLATGAGGREPPVIGGLVLEELPTDMATPREKPVVQDFLRMMRNSREYVEQWVELICRDWHPVDRRSLLENACEADVEIYLSIMTDGATAGQLHPLLARLDTPALMLRGDPRRGGILTDEDWRHVRRYLPEHSAAHELTGSGHELHRGDHREYMRLVTGFLRTRILRPDRAP